MKIKERKISELIPADYNPRVLTDKEFEDLRKSFKNLDILEPAVINMRKGRKNIIISGHQRLRVAESLGMLKYPCIEVDFTLKKEKEANIRMNKNTGSFDIKLLGSEFNVSDLVGWGFDNSELKGIEVEINDVNIAKDLSNELKSYNVLEITCKDENDLEKLFNEIKERGYECKILKL